MPIYEYSCRDCDERFEKLVRRMSEQEKVVCPKCGSSQTARSLSLFAVSSESKPAGGNLGPGMCGRCGGPGPCAMEGMD